MAGSDGTAVNPDNANTEHAILGLGIDVEDVVTEGDAATTAFDDGSNTIVVGATVEAALNAVEAEFVAPTHDHGGGSLFSSLVHTADLTLTGSLQTVFDLGPAVTGHTYFFRGHLRISGLANSTTISINVAGAASSNFTLTGVMMEAGGAGEHIVSADTAQSSGTVVVPFDTGGGAPASILFEGTFQSGGTTNITIKVSESAGSGDAVTHGFVEYFDADA